MRKRERYVAYSETRRLRSSCPVRPIGHSIIRRSLHHLRSRRYRIKVLSQ